jgi:hypothetical protein
MLPIIFSVCEFTAQTGGGLPSTTTPRVINLTKSSGTGCTGPSGNYVPGGFGWLTTDSGTCRVTSAVGNRQSSSTGNTPSNGCRPADFAALQNREVLLPLFQVSGGNGANAWYQVYGYAAFRITGYYFAGQYSWNKPCSGNARCLAGYFTRYVDLDDTFTYGPTAPDLGARVVDLIR